MKNPTFILTSDWHLRDTKPVARTDAFFPAMWKKVMFIKELAEKYHCDVLHSGDLFHRWNTSPNLLTRTIRAIPKGFFTVFGNHDLPEHSMEQAEESGVFTLWVGGHIEIPLYGVHWNKKPERPTIIKEKRNILMWHVLTYKGKDLPYPGCTEMSARQILKKYPEYDLIVTGDNHKTFVEEYQGRLLVNPGSILRMTAAQIDHKPCVFLYYAETNTVEQVFIPIEDDVLSREHIEEKEERNNRIQAFISSLNPMEQEAGLSFEKNMDAYLRENKVSKSVKKIIYKCLE